MHGIFPTHNKYYIRTEIFPHMSKKEIKEVWYADKKSIATAAKQVAPKNRSKNEDEE